MQRRRVLEMLGSFVLGGGLVVMVYELGGRAPAVTTEPVAETAGEVVREDPVDVAGTEIAATPDGVGEPVAPGQPDPYAPGPDGSYAAYPPIYEPPAVLDAAAEAKFPKHGLVTGQAVLVRERTEKDGRIVGILRAGTRVRADAELSFGGGCTKGWHAIHPSGWICLNAGLEVGDTPPDDGRSTSRSRGSTRRCPTSTGGSRTMARRFFIACRASARSTRRTRPRSCGSPRTGAPRCRSVRPSDRPRCRRW
jgi:hypothetical protein